MAFKRSEIPCAVVLGADRLYAIIAQRDKSGNKHNAGHHNLIGRRSFRAKETADKEDVDKVFGYQIHLGNHGKENRFDSAKP